MSTADGQVLSFVLQGGNLALLAVVLVGIYRLLNAFMPFIRQGVQAIIEARAAFAELATTVSKLEGRGVCPVLQQRSETDRPTDPVTSIEETGGSAQ